MRPNIYIRVQPLRSQQPSSPAMILLDNLDEILDECIQTVIYCWVLDYVKNWFDVKKPLSHSCLIESFMIYRDGCYM